MADKYKASLMFVLLVLPEYNILIFLLEFFVSVLSVTD